MLIAKRIPQLPLWDVTVSSLYPEMLRSQLIQQEKYVGSKGMERAREGFQQPRELGKCGRAVAEREGGTEWDRKEEGDRTGKGPRAIGNGGRCMTTR